jgi:hypothetical protein
MRSPATLALVVMAAALAVGSPSFAEENAPDDDSRASFVLGEYAIVGQSRAGARPMPARRGSRSG